MYDIGEWVFISIGQITPGKILPRLRNATEKSSPIPPTRGASLEE